jgi:hypothetical protein
MEMTLQSVTDPSLAVELEKFDRQKMRISPAAHTHAYTTTDTINCAFSHSMIQDTAAKARAGSLSHLQVFRQGASTGHVCDFAIGLHPPWAGSLRKLTAELQTWLSL